MDTKNTYIVGRHLHEVCMFSPSLFARHIILIFERWQASSSYLCRYCKTLRWGSPATPGASSALWCLRAADHPWRRARFFYGLLLFRWWRQHKGRGRRANVGPTEGLCKTRAAARATGSGNVQSRKRCLCKMRWQFQETGVRTAADTHCQFISRMLCMWCCTWWRWWRLRIWHQQHDKKQCLCCSRALQESRHFTTHYSSRVKAFFCKPAKLFYGSFRRVLRGLLTRRSQVWSSWCRRARRLSLYLPYVYHITMMCQSRRFQKVGFLFCIYAV